jgi:hypothetical protein
LAGLERNRAAGLEIEAVEKRERAALAILAGNVEARSAALKTALGAVYQNPTLAGFQWERQVADHGQEHAAQLVRAKPELLGDLRGRRWVFGLVSSSERRDALRAVSEIAPAAAGARHAKAKHATETWQREATIAEAQASPVAMAARQAEAELARHGISAAGIRQQARDLAQQLKRAEQQRQAEERALAATMREIERHVVERDRGAPDYQDAGIAWQAMPAKLKAAVGLLTSQTEEGRAEVLEALADRLRGDPAAAKLVREDLAALDREVLRNGASWEPEPEPPDRTPTRRRSRGMER